MITCSRAKDVQCVTNIVWVEHDWGLCLDIKCSNGSFLPNLKTKTYPKSPYVSVWTLGNYVLYPLIVIELRLHFSSSLEGPCIIPGMLRAPRYLYISFITAFWLTKSQQYITTIFGQWWLAHGSVIHRSILETKLWPQHCSLQLCLRVTVDRQFLNSESRTKVKFVGEIFHCQGQNYRY